MEVNAFGLDLFDDDAALGIGECLGETNELIPSSPDDVAVSFDGTILMPKVMNNMVVVGTTIPQTSITLDNLSASKPKSTKKRKQQIACASRKHRVRRKDEVCDLKRKIIELENTLHNLQTVKSLETALSSPWEIEARNQCMLRDQALLDNKKLKEMLQEQNQLAMGLQKLLMQKPTLHKNVLSNYGAEINDYLKEDPMQRRLIINAILDRQYRRTSSVLLQTGLCDASENINVSRFVPGLGGREDYEILKHQIIEGVDFREFSNIVFHFASGSEMSCDFMQRAGINISALEDIDCRTNYVQLNFSAADWFSVPIPEIKLLTRRYEEANRVVITWKTIKKDDLFPSKPTTIQPAETNWVIFEDATDKCNPSVKVTKLTAIIKCSAVPVTSSCWQENADASKQFNTHLKESYEKHVDMFENMFVNMAKLKIR